MSDSLKKYAEELLRVASAIEKDAAEVTQFVCNKCNHTASLSKINGIRGQVAKTAGAEVTVSEITVNDSISCPACEGTMSYQATEESNSYYFDPAKQADEKTETPAEEAKETPAEEKKEKEEGKELPMKAASIDYDALEYYTKG